MTHELSNIPQSVPMRIKQGSAYSFTAKFPFSLTGMVLRLRAKKSVTSTDLLFELSTDTGEIILSTQTQTDDTATVSFAESLTAALPCGCWVFDFERDAHPVFSGPFEIVGEV